MFIRTTLAATVAAVTMLAAGGCAVTRNQETVGAYVDDTAITTAVKARFVENKRSRRNEHQRRDPQRHRDAVGLCQEHDRKEHRRSPSR